MLVITIGWLWIAAGILFFIKPAILQKRLQRRTTKKIGKYLFAVAFFSGMLLVSVSWKVKGILPKIVMIVGLGSIFKGFFFLKAGVSTKLINWINRRGCGFFRVVSLGYVFLGLLILGGIKH